MRERKHIDGRPPMNEIGRRESIGAELRLAVRGAKVELSFEGRITDVIPILIQQMDRHRFPLPASESVRVIDGNVRERQ